MNSTEQAEALLQQAPQQSGAPGVVSWQASEYLEHQKPTGWYGMIMFLTVAIAFVMFLILKDFIAPILFALIGLSFLLFGRRQPETLSYSVGPYGVQIGAKRYAIADFKSFSMMEDDGILSIQLNPLKRFLPAFTLYLDPEDADMVADAFSMYLPHEDKEIEFIDRLARKLRF